MTSRDILNSHKDTMINLQSKIHDNKMQLQSLQFANDRYNKIKSEVEEIKYEMRICESDLYNLSSCLWALQDQYNKIKEELKEDLERKLTDTINTWYNEDVDLKFVAGRTTGKDKKKTIKLIDINKGVAPVDIMGDAACQTIGLLVAVCIAKMRGLSFLFLDEPFSNFNEESAKKVPELLESIIGDMQLIIVENKETILDCVKAYQFNLDKQSYTSTRNGKSRKKYKSIIASIENKDMYIPLGMNINTQPTAETNEENVQDTLFETTEE